MNSLKFLQKSINPGKIFGLGESSHGSSTEFKCRSSFIFETIKNNPEQKFIIYIEAYKDPILELMNHIQSEIKLSKETVIECLNKNYKFLQTKEMYDFVFYLWELISSKKIDIKIHGIDFNNQNEKKSMDPSEMLRNRSKVMFNNIKSTYQPDAVHFILAHNLHVGSWDENLNEMGNLIINKFKNNYVSIAQHVSNGKIRARNPDGLYIEVNFEYKQNMNSLTELSSNLFKKTNKARMVISSMDIKKYKTGNMEMAGFVWPMQDPWITKISDSSFDFIVLHDKSEANQGIVI